MSNTNHLLYAVGNISTPQEGAAALLASITIQAFKDMQDVEQDRETRRDAKRYLVNEGNDYIEEVVGKRISLDLLVTC